MFINDQYHRMRMFESISPVVIDIKLCFLLWFLIRGFNYVYLLFFEYRVCLTKAVLANFQRGLQIDVKRQREIIHGFSQFIESRVILRTISKHTHHTVEKKYLIIRPLGKSSPI